MYPQPRRRLGHSFRSGCLECAVERLRRTPRPGRALRCADECWMATGVRCRTRCWRFGKPTGAENMIREPGWSWVRLVVRQPGLDELRPTTKGNFDLPRESREQRGSQMGKCRHRIC